VENMPKFQYTIVHVNGKERDISVEAETEEEALLLARVEVIKFSREVDKDEDLR
jgi:hypothetical protein